jgi:hypothetical protein
VGSINHSPDRHFSAAEALEALLHRTSSKVLQKLREDDVDGTNFEKSLIKERGTFPEISATKVSFSPQISSSGPFQDSAGVPIRSTFGAGASGTLFGDSKASQGSSPGLDQALTAVPTGRLFDTTFKGSHFGDNPTAQSHFGNTSGAFRAPSSGV